MKQRNYKVGDKVRVIKSNFGSKGKIGRISHIDSDRAYPYSLGGVGISPLEVFQASELSPLTKVKKEKKYTEKMKVKRWVPSDEFPFGSKVKKDIKYGEPCPECGLSWGHGNIKCNYPYPPNPTRRKGKVEDTIKLTEIAFKEIQIKANHFRTFVMGLRIGLLLGTKIQIKIGDDTKEKNENI